MEDLMEKLDTPFPWFGGKSRVADMVWERFRPDIGNYVEPFFGSGAVLLGRPGIGGTETVNDLDGFISNFWRSVKLSPQETAQWADKIINENDLHAVHVWLRERRADLTRLLEGDPNYHDPKIAGWWVWGTCCWIGGGWCNPNITGPWVITKENGNKRLMRTGGEQGVKRVRPHLGDKGTGVNRKLLHLGDSGQGVNRNLPHLGNKGRGVNRSLSVQDWFQRLSDRFANVRVCSGNWDRILGPSVTFLQGPTAVFLDPPYSQDDRDNDIYASDSKDLAKDVNLWCVKNGDNKLLRIALCGYEGEHNNLTDAGWDMVAWKPIGGYGSQSNSRGRDNAARERIWFSPGCLPPAQPRLL